MEKDLALTADKKKVVEAKSKEARYFFAEKGQEIPDALAKKYGLMKIEKSKEKSEDKSMDKPEDKSVSKPETK